MKYRRSVSLSPRGFIRLRRMAGAQKCSLSACIEDMLAESSFQEVTDDEVERYKADMREKQSNNNPGPAGYSVK